MVKKYKWIRVDEEAFKVLRQRLERINNEDLRKIGIKKGKIPQIEFTKFLFKNTMFIRDSEIKQMVNQKMKDRKSVV